MGILGKLLGRTHSEAKRPDERRQDDSFDMARFNATMSEQAQPDPLADPDDGQAMAQPENSSVNIWDLDGLGAEPAKPAAPMEEPAKTAAAEQVDITARLGDAPARKRRTKTRLLGFDKSDGQVVDLFNNPVPAGPSRGARFPVGWVVVVKGPGRGESFAIHSGMSSIGRGEDQAVALDFGDTAISRTNHAAIVYDPESFQFFLGHGGKSNIVRLNDKPVISNEALKNGDLIRLGETTLRFVALCDEAFNWGKDTGEEADDVEIA